MHVRRISGLILVASLLAFLPACVIHSGGESFAFGGDDYKAERQETLALELAAGEALDVELPYGDIAVRVADGEAAHVDAHWHAGGDDQAMAQAVLARYKLELTRGPAQVTVRAVGEALAAKGTFSMKRYGASVDLVLVVPSGVKLSAVSSSGKLTANGALGACRLKSSYGDVSASGVRGETLLQTASGKATVAEIDGPSIKVTSQYGDVSARALQAATVELSSSSGSVSAERVRGTLKLNSGYGSLSVRACEGDLDAKTSSGDIAVDGEGVARRTLSTSYGDISVRGAHGTLQAKTASGEVQIDRADGSVEASSSYGDVTVKGRIEDLSATTGSGEVAVIASAGSRAAGAWKISSAYGDALVRLPADFACVLEASAPSGNLACEFGPKPSGEEKPPKKLVQTLGAGGGTVKISSASGDVSIARGKD